MAGLLLATVNSAVMNCGSIPVGDNAYRSHDFGVIPAFPRCAGTVSAATGGENDEFGVGQ